MAELTKMDRTEAREKAYPSQMGQAMGQFGSAWIEQSNIALDKSMVRAMEVLGRPNVKVAERISLMDGTNMTVGLSLPAAMMTHLNPRGPKSGKIKGSMRVRETNKASENDKNGQKWNINGGAGWALWHVDTSLTVEHSHTSEQSRETDYSSYMEWEADYGEYDTPEGVAIIQDTMQQMVRAACQVNLALAQRKIDALQADDEALAKVEPDQAEMPADGPTTVETSGDQPKGGGGAPAAAPAEPAE